TCASGLFALGVSHATRLPIRTYTTAPAQSGRAAAASFALIRKVPEQNKQGVFARMRAERERIARPYRAEGEEQPLSIRADAHLPTGVGEHKSADHASMDRSTRAVDGVRNSSGAADHQAVETLAGRVFAQRVMPACTMRFRGPSKRSRS